MSAFGGQADANHQAAEGPLLALCGRLPVGKGFFFDGDAALVGAAMGPACLGGAYFPVVHNYNLAYRDAGGGGRPRHQKRT